jgi:mannose-6-phosphate isomerase-like protein (cupin superfamily)
MPLERHRLDSFTKGWFVGEFEPTLVPSSAVEVAVKHYRAGEHEDKHHHRVAEEVTVIVSGTVRMSGEELGAGEIVRIPAGTATDFLAVTDATTVVVKLPCVKGDKYSGAISLP